MWHVVPLLALLLGQLAWAAAPLPHLDAAGQEAYQAYLAAPEHKAFAIAPGGAWGWKAELMSLAQVQADALVACQANTAQKCVLYARDQQVVFNPTAWATLWGPYASAVQAAKVPVGLQLGQRFPDLLFGDGQSVQGLRGKVRVLHFWGSWCGPCRREMPQLQQLHDSLKANPEVAFVLLQAREKFAVSVQWAQAQGLALPLFDSGYTSAAQPGFLLKEGGRLPDRELARVFPTTYVLDKHGLVVFAHFGPVDDWRQYRDFLLDAARRSGR